MAEEEKMLEENCQLPIAKSAPVGWGNWERVFSIHSPLQQQGKDRSINRTVKILTQLTFKH